MNSRHYYYFVEVRQARFVLFVIFRMRIASTKSKTENGGKKQTKKDATLNKDKICIKVECDVQ